MPIVNPAELIRDVRAGRENALGSLLEHYRNYLRLLARTGIGRRLQAKIDASDLVQETFLDAQKAFHRFEGVDEPQLARWLRQIMAGKIGNLVRHYCGTQGRDVGLEQELAPDLEKSTELGKGLVAALASPSQQAACREEAVLLADALARLPNDYREVIILRHLDRLTFPEVAAAMGRTEDSVEKLWARALARLKLAFGDEG